MRLAILSTALVVAAAVTVTACNKADEPPPSPPKTIMVRSAAQKQLFEMSEMNRMIGLKRSIQASGSRCKRVTSAHYAGRYKNMDMWTVGCDDDREWALFISADDSVQVRLCKDTEAVGLPSCATKAQWPHGQGPATEPSAATENRG